MEKSHGSSSFTSSQRKQRKEFPRCLCSMKQEIVIPPQPSSIFTAQSHLQQPPTSTVRQAKARGTGLKRTAQLTHQLLRPRHVLLDFSHTTPSNETCYEIQPAIRITPGGLCTPSCFLPPAQEWQTSNSANSCRFLTHHTRETPGPSGCSC